MMDTKLIEVAVNESESMITSLMSAAERMQRTIENETHLRRMLKEAEQALENAEAEVLFEAEIAAQDKHGLLANLAKTSAAYKAATTKLLAEERRNGGPVGELARQVDGLRVRLDQAQIEREQAADQFSACKHAADLKTSILRAMVLDGAVREQTNMIHYDVSNTVKIAGLCGATPNGRDAFQWLDIESPRLHVNVDCPACQERFVKLWGSAVGAALPLTTQQQRGNGL